MALNGGIKLVNKLVLNEPDNAVSHSKSGERCIVVTSCASGHQQSAGGRQAKEYFLTRNGKLRQQAAAQKSNIFVGVIAYINGYTGKGVTNERLKDVIEEGGGQIRTMPSGQCTHVIVQRNLSGSKADRLIKKRYNKTKYVQAAWAIESAQAGRRLAEAKFAAPLSSETQTSVHVAFNQGHVPQVVHPAAAETAKDFDIASPERITRKRARSKDNDLDLGPKPHQTPNFSDSHRLDSFRQDAGRHRNLVHHRRSKQKSRMETVDTIVIASSQSLSCSSQSAPQSSLQVTTRSQTVRLLPSASPPDAAGGRANADDRRADASDEDGWWDLPPSAQLQ
ncbi:hypothetical protein OIO90_002014 [Microbotryomycetes sp. JL221]|nr:hypothetical protein OIO90_002014 [Microbotryomycetes sp. JL221]